MTHPIPFTQLPCLFGHLFQAYDLIAPDPLDDIPKTIPMFCEWLASGERRTEDCVGVHVLELVAFFTKAIQILLKDQFYAAFLLALPTTKKMLQIPHAHLATFRAGRQTQCD